MRIRMDTPTILRRALMEPDVYAEPPAGGMVDQNGNGVPGQGF